MTISGASKYLEDIQLKWAFQATAPPAAPATVYVALFTTMPAEDGTAGVEVSPTSTGYARVAVTGNATNWPISGTTPQQVQNASAVQFPTATASWGTVVGFGIYDAATAGNLLYGNSFTGVAIGSGVTPQFNANQLTVTED